MKIKQKTSILYFCRPTVCNVDKLKQKKSAGRADHDLDYTDDTDRIDRTEIQIIHIIQIILIIWILYLSLLEL